MAVVHRIGCGKLITTDLLSGELYTAVVTEKKWKAPFMRFLVISGRYPTAVLAQVLLLAAVRFTVFCLQLYALMLFVGFPADAFKALTLIPLLFIAQTAVPSFVLTDLGVRGGLALFLFEPWAGSACLRFCHPICCGL